MKQYNRLDFFEDDFSNVERTDEGFAHFFARATRTGVFQYRNQDGSIRRELRHPDEVFDEKSMRTLENKVVTNNHPKSMVDSKNAKYFTVGMTGNEVKADGEFLKTKTIITDQDTIDDVTKKGKVQLSCGYKCEHDVTPGVFNGDEYDLIQRNIRYNHLAIVDVGRAGPEAKLRLDSEDAIMVNESKIDSVKPGKRNSDKKNMEATVMDDKIVIDGVEQEVSDSFKKLYDSQIADLTKKIEDSKTAQNKNKDEKELDSLKEDHKKDLSKLQAKIDSLEAKKDKESEQEKKEKIDSEINDRVKKRLSLYDAAKDRCEKEVVDKLDEMSDLEIKKAVIKSDMSKDSEINLDEKDDTYVDHRFDFTMEKKTETKDDSGLGAAVNLARTGVKKNKDGVDQRQENYKQNLTFSKANKAS